MTPNALRWLAASAAAAAAGLCWHLLSLEPESMPPTAGNVRALSAQVSDNGAVAKPAKQWPEFGTLEFKSLVLERGRNWLSSRHRDASSLVAMWDITGDEALLAEAAEKFPNDPRVCLIMIRQARDAEDRLPWIERLLDAEPENPEGYYMKAWALNRLRDRAGSIAALHQAVAINAPRENHLRDRALTVRVAALACGCNERDAAYCALMGPLDWNLTRASLHGVISVIKGEMNEATATGDEDRLLEIAGIGLAMVGSISTSSAGLVFTASVANSMESELLQKLPADAEIGTTGRLVAQRRQEVITRARQLMQLNGPINAASRIMESASDAVLTEYVERFALLGQEAATLWLLDEAETER